MSVNSVLESVLKFREENFFVFSLLTMVVGLVLLIVGENIIRAVAARSRDKKSIGPSASTILDAMTEDKLDTWQHLTSRPVCVTRTHFPKITVYTGYDADIWVEGVCIDECLTKYEKKTIIRRAKALGRLLENKNLNKVRKTRSAAVERAVCLLTNMWKDKET